MYTKPFLTALNGEANTEIPFWFMRQAGRYLPEYRELRQQAGSFLDLCYNSELACEVTLQPLRRFGMNAAILFADILLVPHGLGQQLDYREGEGPVLEPVRSLEDLKKLDLSIMDDTVSAVYDTVAKLSKALDPDVALIGFAGAPWTVATYMVEGRGSRDFPVIKAWSYQDPEGFAQLIDLVTEATIHYLGKQIEAGADAVQLFDTWSSALNEDGFRRWCLEPAKKITSALNQKYPQIPVIGFPRGAGANAIAYVRETGIKGLGLDWSVPLHWARDNLQPHVALQGNLDPQLLIAGGPAMRENALKILNTLGHGPFIFNLGHGITPQTPIEHVMELSDIIRNWRA